MQLQHHVGFGASAALILAAIAGCSSPTASGFRSPSMTATFQTIPKDEVQALENGLRKTTATETGDDTFSYTFPAQESYPSEQIAAALKSWHQQITAIENDRGTPIVANDRIEIRLLYLSSKAESGSAARIYIEPFPAGAKLYLNTDVPSATRESDGSIRLNSAGKFDAAVPFSFIRSTNRVYFHTVHRGSVRYFYYDVNSETQEEVPAKSMDDFQYYMRNGSLPK